jgi:hypothetical protein
MSVGNKHTNGGNEMLVVTDMFDIDMLTESCELEFKAISLDIAKQLLRVVPHTIYWYNLNDASDVQSLLGIERDRPVGGIIPLYYDTTVMVVRSEYDRAGCSGLKQIWLVTPIKFT